MKKEKKVEKGLSGYAEKIRTQLIEDLEKVKTEKELDKILSAISLAVVLTRVKSLGEKSS